MRQSLLAASRVHTSSMLFFQFALTYSLLLQTALLYSLFFHIALVYSLFLARATYRVKCLGRWPGRLRVEETHGSRVGFGQGGGGRKGCEGDGDGEDGELHGGVGDYLRDGSCRDSEGDEFKYGRSPSVRVSIVDPKIIKNRKRSPIARSLQLQVGVWNRRRADRRARHPLGTCATGRIWQHDDPVTGTAAENLRSSEPA